MAIVTGGASGLCAASAERSSVQADKGAISHPDPEFRQSQATKVQGRYLVVDKTNEKVVESAIAAAEECHGKAPMLVIGVGATSPGSGAASLTDASQAKLLVSGGGRNWYFRGNPDLGRLRPP